MSSCLNEFVILRWFIGFVVDRWFDRCVQILGITALIECVIIEGFIEFVDDRWWDRWCVTSMGNRSLLLKCVSPQTTHCTTLQHTATNYPVPFFQVSSPFSLLIFMCACMYVSMYVCMYVCLYSCMHVFLHAYVMCVRMHAVCICVYSCMRAWVCQQCICMCESRSVCAHLRIFAHCKYVYVRVCVYTYKWEV